MGEFVETIDACDFFDEINFASHFGAPGRRRSIAKWRVASLYRAILIDSQGPEPKCCEN